MDIVTIFLISAGVSMDAFAVSITNGIFLKKIHYKFCIYIATIFAFAQSLMILLGYASASNFAERFRKIDHYVSFILLFAIGLDMIMETFKQQVNIKKNTKEILHIKNMVLLALAISIDAFGLGVSFAFYNNNIFFIGFVVFLLTFMMSYLGVYIGFYMGMRYKVVAERTGGLILVYIAVKIFCERILYTFY